MKTSLDVLSCGPAVAVQDLGRSGFLAHGLTRGGAADVLALHEGAALLGQSPSLAVLEMVGTGGTFRAKADIRIALTGAPMAAKLDGTDIRWNASHLMPAGAELTIGGARSGVYAYLHVGGGIDTPLRMGGRGAHLSAGLGSLLQAGDTLPVGPDSGGQTGMALPIDKRFAGGAVRIVTSMQTEEFDAATRARFVATAFTRSAQANRMGVRLSHDGEPFVADNQLTILSDVIVPGDIQIAGDGAPFVLMCECQTTGGYPRIGTVIPFDMARVAQTPANATLTFEFIEIDEARRIEARAYAARANLQKLLQPLLRDPSTIRDLLSYQLISGAVSATQNPFKNED
jgi:allophanate hydrolase